MPARGIDRTVRRHRLVSGAVLLVVSACVWIVFLNLLKVGMIDSHLTKDPERDGFRVSPWQASGQLMRREATLPLSVYILRYTQQRAPSSDDVETVEYVADIRWVPAAAMFAAFAIPAAAVFGLAARWLAPRERLFYEPP